MESILNLKDIYIGNTDAKNELLYGNIYEIENFKKNFVIPPTLTIEDFENRNKYFITGLKGIGKTALLRYIDIKMNSEDTISNFILFKSDIDEDMRAKISRLSRVELYEYDKEYKDENDYEVAWRWFIYKNILLASSKCINFFEKNEAYKIFKTIIESVEGNNRSILRMFPSVSRGMIKINAINFVSIGLDLEFNQKSNEIKFSSLVRELDEQFQNLKIIKGRINLFFDELELNYNNSKQYKRDAKLIRDLIVAIEKINAIAKRNKLNICIYAAIRSEVLHVVDTLGKEINKPISDFGIEILWHRPGMTAMQQPLLSIIEQRINNARQNKFLPIIGSNEIWSIYFPSQILNKEPYIYILHNSWYRPRDIIRLLKIAKEQFPDAKDFSPSVLEPIRKKYSSDSWVEMSEELKAKYSAEQIAAIKKIFYGGKQVWKCSEFNQYVLSMAENNSNIKSLIERFSINDILDDVYRVGIIGNINKKTSPYKMRFAFRGDSERIQEQDIYLHNALLAHLCIW